jgi:hypothetical protein
MSGQRVHASHRTKSTAGRTQRGAAARRLAGV